MLQSAADSEPRVQFQAALTLGEMKDNRSLAALAQLAHQRSADNWFRVAILSSTADEASPFFHSLIAKGESWTDQKLLVDLSALIGARQNKAEIAQWFRRRPEARRRGQISGRSDARSSTCECSTTFRCRSGTGNYGDC